MAPDHAPDALSFDLFGTLVEIVHRDDPAATIAAELESRGVAVPPDWDEAYRERHVDAPDGAEVPLPAHVNAALSSRGVDARAAGDGRGNVVHRAVVAAFDPLIRTRDGAVEAVTAAAARGPVGVLTNCSVPELARRTLVRSALDPATFDAVVTSAACGWRKPDRRAFETVADRLGVPVDGLAHVGDDPRTDGGATAAGAAAILTTDVPLAELPQHVETLAYHR